LVGAVWLTVATSSGCGGPDYGEAFLTPYRAAQRAQHAGRYEEAAALYLDAAMNAQRVKDRDEAYFNRALMYERMARWQEARDVYREIIRVSPRGPRTARAAFEHATNHIDHGDANVGWTELVRAIERYPNHGNASYAIRRFVMHTSAASGEEQVQKQLTSWLTTLAGTVLEQQLKYEMGHSHARANGLAAAHAWFLRAAREHPYPKGNLTDDALWHAAEVAERIPDHRLALADLEELLGVREESVVTFSYERPRFPQAQTRIAEIYRDELGDLEGARREYGRMYERHPTSILADDAMWQAALLSRKLGDPQQTCAIAKDLPKRYPDSRYTKCVKRLCPAAPAGSRPCPPYIEKQIE
jgi:TolA-binding protein